MNKLHYRDEVIIRKGFYKGLKGIAVEYQDSGVGELSGKFGIEAVGEDQYGIKLDETGKVVWLAESYLSKSKGNKKSASDKKYLKTKTGRKYLPKRLA